MSVTVTIHEGEMKQIAHFIEGSGKAAAKGRLYGLWTHSDQPVIQYVVDDAKRDNEKIKDYLEEKHCLRLVGYWSTSDDAVDKVDETSLSFVKMKVDWSRDEKILKVPKLVVTQKSSRHKKELDGVIETLDGDSAFRLNNGPFDQGTPLQRVHSHPKDANYHRFKVEGPPRKSNEVETKSEQWYSTKEGMALFSKIHAELQKHFQITGTSRNTETHDLTVALSSSRGRRFVLDFPSRFPTELPDLTEGNSASKKIKLKEEKGEGKRSTKNKRMGKTSEGTNDAGDSVGKPNEKKGSQQQVKKKDDDREKIKHPLMECDNEKEENVDDNQTSGSLSLQPNGEENDDKKGKNEGTSMGSDEDGEENAGDDAGTGPSSMEIDEAAQEQINVEKIPKLLVQGILHATKLGPKMHASASYY